MFMAKYTREDIVRIVKEEDVKFIRLQFTDTFGHMKNVAITVSQLEKCLDNQCMFDGSSIEGFVRIEESDMYLRPDIDSFVIFPWRPQNGKVARFICDVYKPDGTPFEGDPRYVLKRVLKEAEEMGYTVNIGPEAEFFLFDTDEHGHATTNSYDEASYFDLAPTDMGEDCRRDICTTLGQMGFEIEASHHEVAEAQHEVDFKYDDALTTADNIMTFKLTVKAVAYRHGLYATFMPKPRYGVCGSGMHTNISLCTLDGKNAFCDASDPNGLGLSHVAYNSIAGLMKHVKGMAAITNPLVNSYKRLVPGYEAPCYIAWSASNRSALIRIPASRGAGTRVELRNPDPACNPYLELAVCIAAGLDGIKNDMTPVEQISDDIYAMTKQDRKAVGIESLPGNLKEALDALEADEYIKNVLGEHVYKSYVAGKKAEWNSFRTAVTEWEIDRYLSIY